jgi:hypothetical protein
VRPIDDALDRAHDASLTPLRASCRLAACILTERQSATSPIRSSSVQAARQASPNYSSPGIARASRIPTRRPAFARHAWLPAPRTELKPAQSEVGRHSPLITADATRNAAPPARQCVSSARAHNRPLMPVTDEAQILRRAVTNLVRDFSSPGGSSSDADAPGHEQHQPSWPALVMLPLSAESSTTVLSTPTPSSRSVHSATRRSCF